MAENLVIVESPAKAKTIEGFLGREFVVKSSYGHVRDLVKADKGVDIENNFEPQYEISNDKKEIISDLKKHAAKAKWVWLATDEDREGEAISWHLSEILKLKRDVIRRIVFHEITKKAIETALKNPRNVDKHLVNAQQARRVLDRLVGFELSPILWKKVKPGLSAGRVQSVAVRLIVEREREYEQYQSSSSYKVTGTFLVYDEKGFPKFLKTELEKRLPSEESAIQLLSKLNGASFTISDLEKKPGKKSPSAPFTTSTLQQEASRKLGFSVAQTMSIAQRLYENGKITYMRTDSVNLSEEAISSAKKEITSAFGGEYSNPQRYKTRSASAQEAHEAIRPTYFNHSSIDGDQAEKRLYELIWKRAIASQMSDAQIERTLVTISNDKTDNKFIATGEVILFDGFLRVYLESTDDENSEKSENYLLPQLTKGQQTDMDFIEARQRFSNPPPRYTEASLVKKLEELGIGRPSTYAPTISTIQKRGYVAKEDRPGKIRSYKVVTLKDNKVTSIEKTEIAGSEKAKLFPTDIGSVVNDFLVQNFEQILDYNFTAFVEKGFDKIAEGELEWREMLKKFYFPFHKTVVQTEKTAERASGERILGKDPESGKTVSVRIGRYGPMAQKKREDDDESLEYASLRRGQRLETITLEEALSLFKLPRNLGQFEDLDLMVAIGRYGPYIRHGDTFYSLPASDDPFEISFERAIQIIEEKRLTPDLARTPRNLGVFEGLQVIVSSGRFGPYIKYDGKFYSISRKEDPWKIELERAIEIINEKKQALEKNVIKEFEENKKVRILKGRFGPYIEFENKNVKIPAGTEPSSLTYEQVVKLAKGDKKKTPVKKAGTMKKTVRKTTRKKKAQE
ncbi:MAG: type I DNA topoisomerase [Bacteroidia bacterium]|nr:type I DNA topoisomerase [Bacteroidia bacterium]MCZ2276733.1 type I DNA topoisomerase [Bacteroidia bacterium]